MNLVDFIVFFRQHKNDTKAPAMAAYMKHKFEFLGIQSPLRRELQKEFLAELTKEKTISWTIVFEMFDLPEREFQMVAIDYLSKNIKKLLPSDIVEIERLIQTKSWWDSVDGMHKLVGFLCVKYPFLIETHIKKWMIDENLWLRRIAIDFQIGQGKKTNTEIMEEVILSNVGTKEFFINKAIGWSLRDFGRHKPIWVIDFVKKYNEILHPLSVREALKHLNKK